MCRAKPEVLNHGSPSPLWVSCCYFQTKCIQFLLEELTPEQIAEPGPDGTTPLMQLFANAVKYEDFASVVKIIVVFFTVVRSKFLLKDVLEGSIAFGNLNIFQIVFKHCNKPAKEAQEIANLAIKSEQVEILKIILKQFPILEGSIYELGKDTQSLEMREFLGLQKTENVMTQLLGMSSKFPKFNEATEEVIQPLPPDAQMVNIEDDIIPLLKEEFCPLDCFGENPKAMPISEWKPSPCRKSKHARYAKDFF